MAYRLWGGFRHCKNYISVRVTIRAFVKFVVMFLQNIFPVSDTIGVVASLEDFGVPVLVLFFGCPAAYFDGPVIVVGAPDFYVGAVRETEAVGGLGVDLDETGIFYGFVTGFYVVVICAFEPS